MTEASSNSEVPTNLKERLKASYDIMAPEYNAWTTKHSPLRLEYLQRLFRTLSPSTDNSASPHHIVELGCGCGTPTLDHILRQGEKIIATGNDLSSTQLALARDNLAAHASRLNLIESDMTKLDFEPTSLTAIVAMYSLIHLPRDEQRLMVDKMARWLKPGGVLLANFAPDPIDVAVFENWLHEKGWMFWSSLGEQGTLEALKEAGFVIESKAVEGDKEENFLWVLARRAA